MNASNKPKEYSLTEAEIMHLIAAGWCLTVAQDSGFTPTPKEISAFVNSKRYELIQLAQAIVPVPFP
jgi:hypothetical protein